MCRTLGSAFGMHARKGREAKEGVGQRGAALGHNRGHGEPRSQITLQSCAEGGGRPV